MNCISCGQEIDSGAAVCPHCGAEQKAPSGETKVCVSCGSVMGANEVYCRICGTSQEVKPAQNVNFADALKCPSCGKPFTPGEKFCGDCGAKLPEVAPSSVPKPPKKNLGDTVRKLPKKTLAIAGGALVVLVVVIVLIATLAGGGGNGGGKYDLIGDNALTYLENSTTGEAVFVNLTGKTQSMDYDTFDECQFSLDMETAMVIIDRDVDSTTGDSVGVLYVVTVEGVQEVTDEAVQAQMSADGSTIYYFGLTDDDGFGPLYRYTVSNGKSEEVTDMAFAYGPYAVSPDGSAVAYVGDLRNGGESFETYLSVNGGEGESIIRNGQALAVSNGGRHVYYADTDSETMYVLTGEEEEELGDDVEFYSLYFNRDATQLVYIDGGRTYISTDGQAGERLNGSPFYTILMPENAVRTYINSGYGNGNTFIGVSDFRETVWEFDDSLYLVTGTYETERIIRDYSACTMSENGRSLLILRSGELYKVNDIGNLDAFDDGEPMYDDESVYDYASTEDLETIYMVTDDYQLLYYTGNNDAERIADDCYSVYLTMDGSAYFNVDGMMYMSHRGGEREKVDSMEEVNSLYSVFKGIIAYDIGDVPGYYYIPQGSTEPVLIMDDSASYSSAA